MNCPLHIKRDLHNVAWNANGLVSRFAELVFEFATRHNPDMILFSKTRLKASKQFRLSKNVFYIHSRPGRVEGGGAIVVRAYIRHHRVDLECTTVELKVASCS